MPESRLERTRRAYDIVIDMAPHGCKLLMVGEPDNRVLDQLWSRAPLKHVSPSAWNDIERGEH